MQVVTPDLVKDKKVLLRIDIDVPIENGQILDDFRLQANMETIELCLHNASEVILMGHIGRPDGEDPNLSVAPIVDWLEAHLDCEWDDEKLKILENLRFESGENDCDLGFAKQLASLGDFFVFEAFAAHHKASSTTILPTLLPHAAGLNFVREVREIREVRENPKRPLIAIVGGTKVEDKYPAVLSLSKFCDMILVGGLLAKLIKEENKPVANNVYLGKLGENGLDLSDDTIQAFINIIKGAKEVIWAGPVGKYELVEDNIGDQALAKAVIESGAESIIGGGDTEDALKRYLDKLTFVSTGGGAMLEFLTKGTLPTIEALENEKK